MPEFIGAFILTVLTFVMFWIVLGDDKNESHRRRDKDRDDY